MAPKEYCLTCSTMTCSSCEKSIKDCLMKLKNVEQVKVDLENETIIVTTSSCSGCGEDCQCCKCDPCNCNPCRCCSCGVDAYIKALEDIGHKATFDRLPKTGKKCDWSNAIYFGAVCALFFAAGYYFGQSKLG